MTGMISRGKRVDSNEWVEGYYVCLNGSEHRIYTGNSEVDCGNYYPEWDNVDPSTVQRCTGLFDRNHNPIYEGDILRIEEDVDVHGFCISPPVPFPTNVLVKWSMYSWRLEVIGNNPQYIPAYDGWFRYILEVVGNCWDNPELLEKDEIAINPNDGLP